MKDQHTPHAEDRSDDAELMHPLRPLDVSPDVAERIRLRARAELARATAPTPIGRARSALGRAYRRSELILVGAVAASYLALAVRAALVPFR